MQTHSIILGVFRFLIYQFEQLITAFLLYLWRESFNFKVLIILKASTSSKMETCVLEETKLQEASGGKKIHGSCGGKKKPQNENKLRKVIDFY